MSFVSVDEVIDSDLCCVIDEDNYLVIVSENTYDPNIIYPEPLFIGDYDECEHYLNLNQ